MAIKEAGDAFNQALVHFGCNQKVEKYDPKVHRVNPPQPHPFLKKWTVTRNLLTLHVHSHLFRHPSLMMLFVNMLLHSFLTSTQNANTSSLSFHDISRMVTIIHRHFCQNRSSPLSLWLSLLNCSQLVFLQNWSSPSSLLVGTSQLLPTGLVAVNIVTELVFDKIDFHN